MYFSLTQSYKFFLSFFNVINVNVNDYVYRILIFKCEIITNCFALVLTTVFKIKLLGKANKFFIKSFFFDLFYLFF